MNHDLSNLMFRKILSVIIVLQFAFFARMGTAQEGKHVPDFFIKAGSGSKKISDKIADAKKQFKNKYSDDKFWIGYQFELRDDIEFDDVYISDDGSITISRHHEGGFYIREDDDLDTHILNALSELGDEKAKQTLTKIKREIRSHSNTNIGLFYLLDAKSLDIAKIKLIYFSQEYKFENYPVYWFEQLDNQESFNYLSKIIDKNKNTRKVVKPAIFVLSLHKHQKVINLLSRIADSDRNFEIRKSAVFWLGQIPEEESFKALEQLFKKEKDGEMREKLVFSISQHESEKVVTLLTEIAKNDRDSDVREKAIFWLGQTDREESLDVLVDILKNVKSKRLKEKVVFSISQHESDRAAAILIEVAKKDQSTEVRKKAIFWLGQMAGKKTLEALGDIVQHDEETDVKTKAVFAISQHSDKDLAAEMLMDIAKNNNNPHVRKKAIFWLGQTGSERVIDYFKEILIK